MNTNRSDTGQDGSLRARLDRWGIALSGLCAVHCVVGLFLVGVLGLGGPLLLAPEVHEYGLVAAIVIGALTIGLGVLRHGRVLPLVLGGSGIALMAFAVVGPHGWIEAVLTIAGVGVLAWGHILNMRACPAPR